MPKKIVEQKKIADFRPQSKNSNKHSQRGMGLLTKAMSEEGWITAITTCNDGMVIDGSARLEVAYEKFGEDVEPIIVRSNGDRPIIHIREDLPNAEDPRAKKLSLYANRVAEVNLEWDADILAAIAEEVDISDMFFDEELAALINEDEVEPEDEEFQPPEPQGIPYQSKFAVAIECKDEAVQEVTFNKLSEMGYKCKVLTL
jgi:hypothetical protein